MMISLDGAASLWAIGILCLALGMVLGCIVTYLATTRYGRNRELQEELNLLKERFTDYRDQVTQHFMRTSELVQEMTQSYRAVYEHLASGAQNLCSDELETPNLDFSDRVRVTNGTESREAADLIDELSSDVEHLEDLLGEAPRISDLDIKAQSGEKQALQH
jgi:uncharacterized membrane-anchored protein YhcB (DUF1043 family)